MPREVTVFTNNSQEEHLRRARMRSLCRQSLYYMVAAVVCWDKKPNKIADAPDVFKASCDWAQKIILKTKRGWGGDPRAHTKSTRWTQSLPLWLSIQKPHEDFDLSQEFDRASKYMEKYPYLKGPDQRILITSYTGETADDFSFWIRSRYESDRLWRWAFPELAFDRGHGLRWNIDSWTLPGRNQTHLEGFLETAGITTQATSHHYDLIILDDPVTEDNYRSATAMQSLVSWFEFLPKLMHQRDRMAPDASALLGVGNFWTDFDLRSYIEQNHPEYDIWHRSCWQCSTCGLDRCVRGPNCRPTNKPLWYTSWTPEGLAAEKESAMKAGPAARKSWFAQLENDPMDPETTLMTEQDVGWYTRDEETGELILFKHDNPSIVDEKIPSDELVWRLACDPANSGDPHACHTAVIHFGEDSESRHFLDDFELTQVDAVDGGAAQVILDMHNRVHEKTPTHQLGLEAVAGQRYVIPVLNLLARERVRNGEKCWMFQEKYGPKNAAIKLFKTQKNREAKIDRIIGLIKPRVESKKLYINIRLKDKQDGALLYQLFRFPNVKDMDLIDVYAHSQSMCEGGYNTRAAHKANVRNAMRIRNKRAMRRTG